MDLQKKYMEYQMTEEQLKSVTEQVQELNQKLMELDYLKGSLDEFGNLQAGTEILAPISNGIFVKAKLSDTDNLLVNVGSGTVVGKNVKNTKELLDSQAQEIEAMRHQMLSHASKLSAKSESLEKELRKLVEDVQVSEG